MAATRANDDSPPRRVIRARLLTAAALLAAVAPASALAADPGVYDGQYSPPPSSQPPVVPILAPAPAPHHRPRRRYATCRVSGLGLPNAPTSSLAWDARLVEPTTLRRAPRLTARRLRTLSAVAPLGGGPVVLLVTGRACDVHNRVWLRVLVPQRPNGTQAWLLRNAVVLTRNRNRIRVDERRRTLTVFHRGRAILRIRVAVGKPSTPTPTGRFAIAERIPTGNPRDFLGPLVFPLTGFSEVLNEYAGGHGRFAIHGTSLPALVGTAVSHGCIRMRNADVLRLARVVDLGTPVTIVR